MDAQLLKHGRHKFPDAGLLASSEGRQWSGLHAELRRHSPGELPSFVSSVTEITYAVRGAPSAHVHRNGGGVDQTTPVREGTLWICPEGVLETGTRITAALPEILHICLRPAFFVDLASDELADVQPSRLRYEADPDDALMRQLAHGRSRPRPDCRRISS
jgi:AraC family transcriptional regulator